MTRKWILPLWAAMLALVAAGPARAEVKLPHLIADHMVLQREMPIRVWGWAGEGEEVRVTLGKGTRQARAGRDGTWRVELPPMPAGGPHELLVDGKNHLVVHDVLVGEVWVCSGQSNMEMGLVKAKNHDQETHAATYPNIRLFTVPSRPVKKSASDVEAPWLPCSPRTVSYFSAVAYFFGRELHRELGVPIGLVVSAVGGTRIEPWTPGCGVAAIGELKGKDRAEDGELYQGLIRPLVPLRIRGVIWYQGEGNVGDGMLYYHRMRALIQGWRRVWDEGDFPFYYVQLSPLNWGGKPVDQLPKVWEAQTAALHIPNTGMVVTNDIGDPRDAHPRNKQDVGKRLALWALAKTYGRKDIVCCGPLYESMKVEGRKVRIAFQNAGDGLTSRDAKPLTWFTIAGADRKFLPAQADVDGRSVLVWSDAVKEPVAVRFAWHQIAVPNLQSKRGLPVSAFRTDDW